MYLILLLYKLKLKIQLVELFYTNSYSFTTVHTDGAGGDYTKMNFIYGGKDSKMIWYCVKSDIQKSINSTNIGTPYIGYELTEVDLIEECSVKFPSIIQVGVPHNILNYEEPRYCLSVILAKTIGRRITMNESLDIFKSYIVI